MRLDDDLREALRPVDPPGNFAARVAAGAVRRSVPWPGAGRGHRERRSAWWMPASLAASLLVATASGVAYLQHERETEARHARDLALRALQLTSGELREIQWRVARHASENDTSWRTEP